MRNFEVGSDNPQVAEILIVQLWIEVDNWSVELLTEISY
jgi:hypothetical protein